MRKITFVARDTSPSLCFKRLDSFLEKQFEGTLIVGEGKPIPTTSEEIKTAVLNSSIVVLGMSSSIELAQEEIFAGKIAKKAGIPYGFYGDVPGCWSRAQKGSWFENLASNTSFYFGMNDDDALKARVIFPQAKLFGTGSPLRDESAFPRFSREEVRLKLGIHPEEKVILASGGKFAAANMATWVSIMEAAMSLKKQMGTFHLIMTNHPGDRTPYAIDKSTQKELELYEELISYSPIKAQMIQRNLLTTSEIVPGADMIIEFGSSIGIEGAYHNIPVISLGFEVWFNYFEKFSGKKTIEAVENGISRLANISNLTDTMRELLTRDGFSGMKNIQKKLYPKPESKDASLQKMRSALLQLI